MTPPAPAAFPSSRTLAELWRQLSALDPLPAKTSPDRFAFWVTHFDVDSVEAMARVADRVNLDPLARLLVGALAASAPTPLQHLQRIVPLSSPIIRQVMRRLQEDGLVAILPDLCFSLTELGRSAHFNGEFRRSTFERRVFRFVRSASADEAPHFLPISARGEPLVNSDYVLFRVAHLLECVRQPAEWKRRCGFPGDVEEVLFPEAGDTGLDAWNRVARHQMERVSMVVTCRRVLRGYVLHPKRQTLESIRPELELVSGWENIFPELAIEPSIELWRQAWREWLATNGLTKVDADSHRLERRGHRLRVGVAKPILERLRAARNEPLRHEAWVLAGTDRFRAAVPLEIVST